MMGEPDGRESEPSPDPFAPIDEMSADQLRAEVRRLRASRPLVPPSAQAKLLPWVERSGLIRARADSAPLDHGLPFNVSWLNGEAWVRPAIREATHVQRAAGAVVDLANGDSQGSGVLVGPRRFLTIQHVGDKPMVLEGKCAVQFTRVVPDPDGLGWRVDVRRVRIVRRVRASDTDPAVTLLELESDVTATFGAFPVTLATGPGNGDSFCVHFAKVDEVPAFKVNEGGAVSFVRRAYSRPYVYKTLSWGHSKPADTPGLLLHGCDTRDGSSGAPIFDADGRLRAIHNGASGADDAFPKIAVDVTTLPRGWLIDP